MKAQDLKNSILQQAIQGKLVEQRPEDGTAEELYQKIQAEKQKLIKEGKIKKEKTLPPITEDEIPFDIPETWKWVRLSDLVKKSIKRGKSPKYTEKSNTLVFAQKCNTKKGVIDLSLALHLDEKLLPKYPDDEFMIDNDIVINSTGNGTLGRVGFYKDSDNPLQMPVVPDSHVTIIRVGDLVDVGYILHSLKYYQPYLEKSCSGSTNQTELSATKLQSLLIPLPPLEEQKRIVAKIEELEPLINQYDQAEQELSALNDKFPEQLKKSILQYAFQGKLVAQDENDEPAEVLYAQIQAEKQKLIKEGKIKKEKTLPPITEDEIPFDIPETWKWVRLSDLGLINPRNNIPDEKEVTFIPMNCLYNEISKTPNTNNKKIWKDLKKGYTHVAENDIILAKITPCFENGKSAILKNLINGFGGATTEVHVFRSLGHLNLKYVLLYLKSPIFMGYATKHMTGTAGQKRVPTEVFANYYFPLPPLEEQNRIVEKIEKIFANSENLII